MGEPVADLAAFIRDRLDDREQRADKWHRDDCAWMTWGLGEVPCDCGGKEWVRRDVEAKRQIVGLHEGEHECVGDRHGRVGTVLVAQGYAHEFCPTLLALAGAWSDHPDFREEWRA